jgi:hypothetical protein
MNAQPEACVDLYWLPLGAGGHSVRLNGRLFEALAARLEKRPTRELYHSALAVTVPDGKFVIEMAPIPDGNGELRGVVAEGPVGSRLARRVRIFRYENRCWRDGVIPDVDEAVDSPQRLTDDPKIARRVVELVREAPTPVWGRDELRAGEMWNSNSLIAWLITRSGIDVDALHPPVGGRAPGWGAGVAVARRLAASSGSADLQCPRDIGDREQPHEPPVVEDERSVEAVRAELLQHVCELIVGGHDRHLVEPDHAIPNEALVPLAARNLGHTAKRQQADGAAVVHDGVGREAP